MKIKAVIGILIGAVLTISVVLGLVFGLMGKEPKSLKNTITFLACIDNADLNLEAETFVKNSNDCIKSVHSAVYLNNS